LTRRKLEIALPYFILLCYGSSARNDSESQFSGDAISGIIMLTKHTTIELDMKDLEDTLRRLEATLDEKDYEKIKALVDAYDYITDLLQDKNTSLARLRKMLFGASTEKTRAVVGGKDSKQAAAASATDEGGEVISPVLASDSESAEKTPPKGHGRNGADAYTGAEKVVVSHESLQPGDPCPECDKGTVYETGRPGVLVRITGRPPIQAKVYELQKLRCNLCGVVFTAQSPEGIGSEKYDATSGSMIALLKYGRGMPFNRWEGLQANAGVPLPASTQWDIVSAKAKRIEPALEELVRQAAQGEVLHNDDTTVKILEMTNLRSVPGKRERNESSAEDSTDDSAKTAPSRRRGMFTSGIVSTCEGRKIALFFSGRKHAGENLADVLARRSVTLDAPIQMCDALSRNLPADLKTIVAHCMAHGRRQFVDIVEQFPDECRHVLESLTVIYHNDAVAKEQNLSPAARRHFHQMESGPTMGELHVWLTKQLDERLVEPNSSLGRAISYMLKYWERLTLFLRVPGAPLDNNICERALKRAILHRKNALFYKTCRGAHVGDVFMSLIHTCELCGTNPFDYLTELERHAGELSANPQNWMPWNYRQTPDAATAHQAPR
jgi:transposase